MTYPTAFVCDSCGKGVLNGKDNYVSSRGGTEPGNLLNRIGEREKRYFCSHDCYLQSYNDDCNRERSDNTPAPGQFPHYKLYAKKRYKICGYSDLSPGSYIAEALDNKHGWTTSTIGAERYKRMKDIPKPNDNLDMGARYMKECEERRAYNEANGIGIYAKNKAKENKEESSK